MLHQVVIMSSTVFWSTKPRRKALILLDILMVSMVLWTTSFLISPRFHLPHIEILEVMTILVRPMNIWLQIILKILQDQPKSMASPASSWLERLSHSLMLLVSQNSSKPITLTVTLLLYQQLSMVTWNTSIFRLLLVLIQPQNYTPNLSVICWLIAPLPLSTGISSDLWEKNLHIWLLNVPLRPTPIWSSFLKNVHTEVRLFQILLIVLPM